MCNGSTIKPGHPEIVRDVLAHVGRSQHSLEHITASRNEAADASAHAAKRRLQRLAASAQSINSSDDARSALSLVPANLAALTRLCDHKFVTYSYSSIPTVWRSIYVHAQLLKACCVLAVQPDVSAEEDSGRLRRCIRDLDLALIVAGAASISEDQRCHDLIFSLQERLLKLEDDRPDSLAVDDSPPRKRTRALEPHSDDLVITTQAQAASNISEYSFDQAPSFMDLASPDSVHRSKPFIVRGFAQRVGWPAVQPPSEHPANRSWSSTQHLLRAAGPARIVPVEVGANYAREDWGQDMILWSDFLSHCQWNQPLAPSQKHDSPECERPVLYMAQHDLASQFPQLANDYFLPEYVYSSPPAPLDWPSYTPPATPDGVITNLWIGPAGTVSPPHFDPFYNCFVQVVGHKELWAAPPHCRPVKARDNPSSLPNNAVTCSSTAVEHADSSVETPANITETLMSNTANVDVFAAQDDVPAHVRSAAFRSVLGPGDLLYLPPGWWHSLRSLTRSLSVSSWF